MIIDIQNFSVNNALGDDNAPVVLHAQDVLLKYGIPAARKANIQIVWLNWGLTERDLETLIPAAVPVFGWRANSDAVDYSISACPLAAEGTEQMIQCGEMPVGKRTGAHLGEVLLSDGTKVNASQALLRGTWNVNLHGPLLSAFQEGETGSRPDFLIHLPTLSSREKSSKFAKTSAVAKSHHISAIQ